MEFETMHAIIKKKKPICFQRGSGLLNFYACHATKKERKKRNLPIFLVSFCNSLLTRVPVNVMKGGPGLQISYINSGLNDETQVPPSKTSFNITNLGPAFLSMLL